MSILQRGRGLVEQACPIVSILSIQWSNLAIFEMLWLQNALLHSRQKASQVLDSGFTV